MGSLIYFITLLVNQKGKPTLLTRFEIKDRTRREIFQQVREKCKIWELGPRNENLKKI